jgi:hypothetical protein
LATFASTATPGHREPCFTFVDLHIEVEAHLVIELALELVAPEKVRGNVRR